MTLIHPRSLERWHEWRRSRRIPLVPQGPADAVGRRGTAPERHVELHSSPGETGGSTLIAVHADDPASRAALLSFLPYLHGRVDVLAPLGLELPELEQGRWTTQRGPEPHALLERTSPAAVLSGGAEHPVGAAVHERARELGVPSMVIQHDLVTPFTAPLPEEATVLAWTRADGELRAAEREDVSIEVVGSQQLWSASHEPLIEGLDAAAVVLGQMHDRTLPRRLRMRAPLSAAEREEVRYRPHCAETDLLSRGGHALLRRKGVELIPAASTVAELASPVIGLVSAEVLLAAAHGLPAWVHAPHEPPWVSELWERYGMRRLGAEPSRAPHAGTDEPARLVAQLLEGA